MVRPLTRKKKKADELYSHPPEVLKNIEGTSGQDLETLARRAREADRKSPEYLKSECLVHLIREAIRRGDEAVYNAILPILLGRCELRLRAKIPDSIPQAEQLREEVLGELGLLFAQDAAIDGSAELDFYECRFDRAFKSLRFDVLAKEANKTARTAPPIDRSTGSDDGESEWPDNGPEIPATQHQELDQEEFLDLLLPNERKAFVLCKLMGYEAESIDPGEVTAATLCGVSGRTIRSLVKSARGKLKRAIQGDT
jgi:hypothetical protein